MIEKENQKSKDSFHEDKIKIQKSNNLENDNEINNLINENLLEKINSLSHTEKQKILSLLRYLEKYKNIKWNSKGEIYYKNIKISGSNIFMLLQHAISHKKTKPQGYKIFYKVLTSVNVPRRLIKNKIGRDVINKTMRKNDNHWKPPGALTEYAKQRKQNYMKI